MRKAMSQSVSPETPVTDESGRRERVARSLSSRMRAVPAWVPFAVSALIGLLIAGSAAVTSLDSTCVRCHSVHGTTLARTAHASVSCYGCHLDGGVWGFIEQKSSETFRMYPASLQGAALSGPGRRVPRSTCIRCHESLPADILEKGGIRIRHDACAAPPEGCDTCHNTIAHAEAVRWPREPVMDQCVACHGQYGATVKCDACHAGKLQQARLTSGPWQVTHGPRWQQTHGMGDLSTCTACHEPSKCVKCHRTEIPHPADFFRTHGRQALNEDARCTQCHATKGWCTSCHGTEMPHKDGFLKTHSKSASSPSDKTCRRCHGEADCKNCHEAHTHPGNTQGTMGGAFEVGTPPTVGGDQ